jgi:hypothetical protein
MALAGLSAPAAFASSVTSAVLTGGAGTISSGGTLYAKSGAVQRRETPADIARDHLTSIRDRKLCLRACTCAAEGLGGTRLAWSVSVKHSRGA